MSEFKGTPWVATKEAPINVPVGYFGNLREFSSTNFTIRQKDGIKLLEVSSREYKDGGKNGFTKEEAGDISNLLSAAPELLEALEYAIPYIQGAYECAFPDEQDNEWKLEKAKAAIAKALGKEDKV